MHACTTDHGRPLEKPERIGGKEKEVGTGWRSGGLGVGEGDEMGLSRIEWDGGLLSLGVTGSSIDQQCRTGFRAPKYARGTAVG